MYVYIQIANKFYVGYKENCDEHPCTHPEASETNITNTTEASCMPPHPHLVPSVPTVANTTLL